MTDWEPIVEELAALEPGARLVIESEDGRVVHALTENPIEFEEPEETYDRYSDWIEGWLTVHLRVDEEDADEYDLIFPVGTVTARTDGGEWQQPMVSYSETLPPKVESEEDLEELDQPWSETMREEYGFKLRRVVPAQARRYREPAASVAEELAGRQKSMARAVMADAVVSYVAEEGVGDVWGEYSEETDEASVSEFVEWLSAREFADLLDERGGEVFPEREEMLDVSQRTARDALVALRYFRRQE